MVMEELAQQAGKPGQAILGKHDTRERTDASAPRTGVHVAACAFEVYACACFAAAGPLSLVGT
jgi:hypothetical protein